MTWAQYIATGSGSLAFRLDIGGLPTQFVGMDDMAAAATFGVQARTVGLKMRGQKIRERADIARATLEVGGMQPMIVDVSNLATLYLGKVGHPTETTWLATPQPSASATTITVSSTTGFTATNGYIWIDSECISYTAVTATEFTGCTRGVFNTLAQAHYIADGASLRYPAVTNQPITLEGQRVRLYAYGELDAPTGDGTLIYTGVVSRDARYDGTAWSIGVDPLTRLLSQRLGSAGSTSTTNRGIYYPANAPFGAQFTYYAGPTGGGDSEAVEIFFPVTAGDTAYFESNAAFCAYLNDKIAADATISAWLTKFKAVPDGESGWHIDITVDAATARAAVVDIIVPGDGAVGIDGLDPRPVNPDTGVAVGVFLVSATYQQRSIPGLGANPRCYFVGTSTLSYPRPDFPATFAQWPDGRLYTGGAVAPPGGTRSVIMHYPDGTAVYMRRPYAITAGRIDIDVSDVRAASLGSRQIAAGITYPVGIEYVVVHYDWGGVGDFISAITAAAAADVNLGAGPDLRTGDIDYSAFPGTLTGPGWSPFLVTLQFPGLPKHTLGEVISAECQAAGLFLRLDPTVGITTSRIKRPVASEAATYTIPAILAKSLPSYEHSSRGLINTVSISTGYDPAEDEHTGPTLFVRDVSSFGRSPNGREVEINRLSLPNIPAAAMSAADAVDVAGRIFGLFGAGYGEVTVDVPLTFFAVTVGSVVALTAGNIPSTDGTIGITARPGIVVGREHDLTAGVLTLSIIVSDVSSAGYAPAAQIATETNVSGNIWDVTLANTEAPTGTTSSQWFEAGNAIRVWLFDNTTPTVQTGDVTSVIGSTVRITLDGAATLGTGDWILEYDAASAWAANPDPPFLFLATSAGRVSLPTALPAWGFSP